MKIILKLNDHSYSIFKHLRNKYLSIITFLILILLNNYSKCEEFSQLRIDNFHNALEKSNFSEKKLSEKFEILKITISDTFNYKKMIRFIYGFNWKKLNNDSKKELSETFLDYITFNYVKRFDNLKMLEFKYKNKEKIDENRILVKTIMITLNEDPIKMNYVFEKHNDSWKIFDVLLDGSISEISVKKSEFKNIILNEGVDSLIEKLKFKMQSLER